MLMDSEQHLGALLEASLSLHDASYGEGEWLRARITNTTDVDFPLYNNSRYGFYGHTDLIDVS